jgi:hypothetical protein
MIGSPAAKHGYPAGLAEFLAFLAIEDNVLPGWKEREETIANPALPITERPKLEEFRRHGEDLSPAVYRLLIACPAARDEFRMRPTGGT